MKDISVIVPFYNVKEYIEQCLNSILKAIAKIDAEVILIDDGSTDGSGDAANAYAEKYDNFSYYRRENQGISSSRNYGLKLATGKYVAFVDSDDVIDPDYLMSMLDVAERYSCDMVVTDASRIIDGKKVQASLHRMAFYDIDHLDISLERYNNLIFDTTVWNRLVLRSLYTDNNIEFPLGHQYEDFPVVWELNHYAKRVRFIRSWGYYWRKRSGDNRSITQKHEDFGNINDKIATFEMSRSFAKKTDQSELFNSLLDYRMLIQELNGNIMGVKMLIDNGEVDDAKRYIDIMACYLEENIDLSGVTKIPLYDRQKIDCILRRDLEGLVHLMIYKEANYENAPVVKSEDSYTITLPSSIFPIKDRDATYEYVNRPFFQSVDSIELSDGKVTLHPHVYARRIDMPDIDSQKIMAKIVSRANDATMDLEVSNEIRHTLTEIKGRVINYDDYKEYFYNYDGTGFSVTIDLEELCKDPSFTGKNYVWTKCSNDYGESTQLLRYGSRLVKRTIGKGHTQRIGDCIVTIRINDVDYFEICIEHYLLDRVFKECNTLYFSIKDPLFVQEPVLVGGDKKIPLRFDKTNRYYYVETGELKDIDGSLRLECRSNGGEYVPIKVSNGADSKMKRVGVGEWACECNDAGEVVLNKRTGLDRVFRFK